MGNLHYQGGLSNRLLEISTTQLSSCDPVRLSPQEEHFDERTNQHSSFQGSHRTGQQTRVTRFLFSPLSGSQAKPEVETCDRPLYSQYHDQDSHLQDGHPEVDPRIPSCGLLGIQPRPQGRLLSDPRPSSLQEISTFRVPRRSFSIQGPSLRDLHSSLAFHQGRQSGQGYPSFSRRTPFSIPGRLAGRSSHTERCCTESSPVSRTLCNPRIHYQPGKVRTLPHSTICFCGHVVRPQSWSGQGDRQELGQTPQGSGGSTFNISSYSSTMAQSVGYHHFSRISGSSWQTAQTSSSMVSSRPLVSSQRPPGSSCSPRLFCRTSSSLVDGSGPFTSWCPSSPPRVHYSHLYGRLQCGLGCPLQQQPVSGSLVSSGISTPHKCVRDESCQTGSPLSSTVSIRCCPGGYRQPYCSILHQSPGRHQISVSLGGIQTALSGISRSQDQSSTHSRQTQCHSGSIISPGSDSIHGVDSTHGCSPGNFQSPGHSQSRSVCHTSQPQVSSVCISSARCSSSGGGRSLDFMGENVGICLSSNQDSTSSSQEVRGDSSLQADSCSSSVAQTTVVSQTHSAGHKRTHKSSSHEKTSSSTKVRHCSSRSFSSQSSRLAPSKRKLIKEGFSEEIASRITAPQAKSSCKLYQAKWNVFVKWCGSRKIDPHKAAVPEICDFLLFLFKEKHYSIKTLQGYRTAIAGALKHLTRDDLGQDLRLSNLLRSFRTERPVVNNPFPPWNLTLVLHALIKEPFEPLGSVDLKLLTLKTVFLLLFASGSRRGEVHALDVNSVTHTPNWDSVTIAPIPEFIAKTQRRSTGASTFEPITLPALAKFTGSDLSEGKLLCPVRALKIYLARTKEFRHGRRLLFISYQKNRLNDIGVNTISIWIKSLLKLVYDTAHEDASVLTGRSTHAIRSLTSSLAFFKNVSLDAILKACSWKTHSTFSEFYLKDITQIRDELFVLGPLVAAQTIV